MLPKSLHQVTVMSQNEDLSFKPLDDWTFTNERDLDRGVVEVLQRDKCEFYLLRIVRIFANFM